MDRYTRHHDGRFAKAGEAVSAKALHRAKQTELAAREAGSSKGEAMLTLHPMFAARLKDLELEGRDTATVKRNRYALKRLSEWLTELSLDPKQLTRLDVQRYKAHLRETVAETTANREFTMVKAAYKFAVEDIRVLGVRRDARSHCGS